MSRSTEILNMRSDFTRLYPLHRSITGKGLRQSLDILGKSIPLQRVEVPSGTKAFDWTVPEEWVVGEAYVIDPSGNRILDVNDHNLHLLNYSAPFRGTVSKEELDAHLYSRPDVPDAIPYVTSYYERRWGFCIPHNQRVKLPEGKYQVIIDTDFIKGAVSYGDCILPGKTKNEILFSSNLCHPQMASHELAGPLILSALYNRLKGRSPFQHTFRFFLGPETIGTICYLKEHGSHFKKTLKGGLIVTCAGDNGSFSYKNSAQNNSLIDRIIPIAAQEFDETEGPIRILPFDPLGSDERQYCSPGFNFPVGAFGRSLFDTFPEYHTSLDDETFINFKKIIKCVDFLETVCRYLDANKVYERREPYGEPQLSKYPGACSTIGALEPIPEMRKALMWVLNGADGNTDVLSIAERSGMEMKKILAAVEICRQFDLIAPIDSNKSLDG